MEQAATATRNYLNEASDRETIACVLRRASAACRRHTPLLALGVKRVWRHSFSVSRCLSVGNGKLRNHELTLRIPNPRPPKNAPMLPIECEHAWQDKWRFVLSASPVAAG